MSRQLIFRKVADVRREKELAEKRKNEPLQEISQDHLVRKLFSRFRKSSESKQGAPTNLVSASETSTAAEMERLEQGNGDSADQMHGQLNEKPKNGTKVTLVSEVGGGDKTSKSRTKGSRWAAALGDNKENVDSNDNIGIQHQARSTESIESYKSGGGDSPAKTTPVTSGGGMTTAPKSMMSRWGRLMGRHDTIEEVIEPDAIGGLRVEMDHRPLSISDTSSGEESKGGGGGVGSRSDGSPKATPPVSVMDCQQILANLLDFKMELKQEIQHLHSKVHKIEDNIAEMVARLTQASVAATHGSGSKRTSGGGPGYHHHHHHHHHGAATDHSPSGVGKATSPESSGQHHSGGGHQGTGGGRSKHGGHRSGSGVAEGGASTSGGTSSGRKRKSHSHSRSKSATSRSSPTDSLVRVMLEEEIEQQDRESPSQQVTRDVVTATTVTSPKQTIANVVPADSDKPERPREYL